MPKVVECFFQHEIGVDELDLRLGINRNPISRRAKQPVADATLTSAVVVTSISPQTRGVFHDHEVIFLERDFFSLTQLPAWVISAGLIHLCTHPQFRGYSLPVDPEEPATGQIVCGVTDSGNCALW